MSTTLIDYNNFEEHFIRVDLLLKRFSTIKNFLNYDFILVRILENCFSLPKWGGSIRNSQRNIRISNISINNNFFRSRQRLQFSFNVSPNLLARSHISVRNRIHLILKSIDPIKICLCKFHQFVTKFREVEVVYKC